ncbi:MAG TPA: hypothetical protein VGD58_10610 [Herpetosiphonaceae bacterium]
MLHRRFHLVIALTALVILCSLAVTQRSAAVHAQPSAATVAPQATAEPIELLSSIGGRVNVLDVEGSLAYIGEGGGLAIVDVSDPTQPSRRGYLQLPEFPEAAEVVNTTVYVATGSEGLQIVDVSNPNSPQMLGHYSLLGTASRVQVVGNLAYVLVSLLIDHTALYIIDVGDPAQPVLRGSYDLPYDPSDFELEGTLAYITILGEGLQIIDVSNPASPVLRGSYPSPDYPTSVAVSGNRVYVGGSQSTTDDSGLTTLDVSNPASPTLLGSYQPSLFAVYDMAIAGDLAYVVNGYGSELRIIDVSNPASPVVRSSYTAPNDLDRVLVANGRAYLTLTYGLQIVDVSNPASPALRGSYDTLWPVARVDSAGSFAYIVAEGAREGLHIVDASDPSRPELRGFYPGFVNDVQVVGSLAYLATDDAFQIVDVSNPDAPALLSSRSSTIMPQHILVRGNLAYVSGTTGLTIFNVSDPSAPVTLGTYTRQLSPGYNFDVAGNFAYLPSGYCLRPCTFLIEIVDVSDPLNPTLHGLYEQYASSVDVVNNRAYLASGTVTILDLSNPGQPAPFASYRTPHYASEMEFAGNLAYIADGGQGGLHIAELDASGRLHARATHPTPGIASDLSLAGDVVYVATRSGGLKIFRVHPDLFPSDVFVPVVSQ